jgi:type II secretory pathway component PulF
MGVIFVLGPWIGVVLATIIGVIVILSSRLFTYQQALARTLAIATAQNVSLPSALLAFSGTCGGRFARRVRRLAAELAAGAALPDALDVTRRLLPRDIELMVRIGWATGTLSRVFPVAGAGEDVARTVWRAIVGRIYYFLAVLFIIHVVAGFVLYFIAPKFEAIVMDFGMELPPLTAWVVSIGHVFGKYQIGAELMGLEGALGFYLVVALVGWGDYYIPLIDGFFLRRHTALLLRSLGCVVESGKPLTLGLAILARSYPTGWVKRRLARVDGDVASGGEWIASLASRRLIRRADAAVLESASRAGNLAWALSEAAAAAERRLAHQLQLVLQVVTPLVVLSLGALIVLYAVAFFIPLITLIEKLA